MIMQLIDLGPLTVLHDQDPAPRVLLQDVGSSHRWVVSEIPMKTFDVFRLPPKIHLLPYTVGELTYDVRERLNVMVRKQDIEPE